MSAPNRNTLWGRIIAEELAHQGIDTVCVAPGSRSTPLVVALAEHSTIEIRSHLDERSAAFFALGRAKITGEPTPVVSTSGTAAANFHPAVIEADAAGVPMLVLTADRPPELHESGANQTIDQTRLYGDATRWYRTLPEPEAKPQKLRMLRTTISRACGYSRGADAGPVHLNVPFRKPLAPIEMDSLPNGFESEHARAARGRDGPYVRGAPGRPRIDDSAIASVATAVREADNGAIVVGPSGVSRDWGSIATLAERIGFPVFADPLSGLRFGPAVDAAPVQGGYDGYLDPAVTSNWPEPDVVLRFGSAPTSQALADYLERLDARTFLVDPTGGWSEATFTATDLLEADPNWLSAELAARVTRPTAPLTDRIRNVEADYWELIDGWSLPSEAAIIDGVLEAARAGTTVFVSNSMPVRDLDRFGRPSPEPLTVIGNRGASGIDGITSSALGVGSAAKGDLILVTGDLAFYHDMNGLLALDRCRVDATIVLINNDGGGIFHMLPIEDFDPPFTAQFKTPHGLDFAPTGELYELSFERVAEGNLADRVRNSLDQPGSTVLEVRTDAETNHDRRADLKQRVVDALG